MSARVLIAAGVAMIALNLFAAIRDANAHLVTRPQGTSLQARERSQMTNLYHARYVCRHGARQHQRWACQARVWLSRELGETRAAIRRSAVHTERASALVWVIRQIRAATIIAQESAKDPWPNCPDPYDGSGSSWSDTVGCENNGSWYDSPGYYRCGLQFDPGWERRFGRLCP